MPVIRIDFDNEKVTEDQVKALCEAVQQIVSSVTEIEDVMVYANSSQIKVKIHPIEIFVQLSAHKIKNLDKLVADIKSGLSNWKRVNSFPYPVNFTFVPMEWRIEIGI